ncbi:outer membrane receptor for ferrienterochelin and colicins [Tenacibaculum sp. MAR_2009_124]|uniref:TonB-dependent receptor n=1 Tax=Tenacibaculum sp. MAR_2009_124 TaxID=1250059 RepID=UPI000897B894|nr:TonB-dependent receptor [Tenacibaculum sp. MAR_2009_124]SEB96042.1 outer membrane receptor for ferrienterochelin and colicins [Tenacibaculum sp. MAR_2009_124]
MKYFSLLLLLCSAKVVLSQSIIKGKITFNGEPLEMANIVLKGTSIGTLSDKNGNYYLKTDSFGKQKLEVSSIGFNTRLKRIQLIKGGTLELNFQLKEVNSALEEVVVSGTMKPVKKLDSPVPVEVYSPVFFKKNPAPSIFESISNVNGIRPQVNCSVCNTGDIHINGLEGPYTFVLIDGMPIVSGLSTVYGLTGLPQSLIERVEIVKGPASTLYGSEAVGGVINIITKTAKTAPKLTLESFGSSWGEINADLGLKYNLGETNGLLGVNYFNYQNPIDNNNDGFTDLTLQDRISIFNKFSFSRKNNRVFTVAGRYLYEDRWGGETNWAPKYRGGSEVYGESIYTSRWETFGTYDLPTNEKLSIQFSANGHEQNSYYGDTFYQADQYIGFGQLLWDTSIGKNHSLLLGAAYRYTYYDDNTPATANDLNNEPSITHLPGVFVQDEITLAANNKLLLGARYDYNSVHGGIFSPRINYKWNSENNVDVIRLSLGNGFRVANVFTEDHAALTGNRELFFEDELKPETSWNANVNYVKKITTDNSTIINIDASTFYTYFENKIIPDYETDTSKIIYGNLDGNSVSKGVSLSTDITWQNGLSIIAGATLMDVSVTENGVTERQLLTESFSGTWSISYTLPNIDLKIDYTGNVYAPMDLPLLGDNDPRAPKSPWYSIQNIQLSKKFTNNFELFGGVKNLLNFTPAANSILRSFDPFDQDIDPNKPNLTFDPAYVYASNQGVRMFLGLRYKLF